MGRRTALPNQNRPIVTLRGINLEKRTIELGKTLALQALQDRRIRRATRAQKSAQKRDKSAIKAP